ncbi:PREDICTED: ATP-dependent DNA helicase Q-like SIM [Amphimedon queenslandica]|uniref:DNA 3'-5' helicase n=1 Tax=Amphimedon queenslandica TaxID=400682 RepID=A0A1X7UT82_AMPQE|nr:PREDICTED: ATP-dependent DNA helicase Q-like SIM [Amphimedon queenslandica]|eukprot:XP_019852358.1 PREDICTED: ATP-dependent DNA helicase Q-like SIM [Amphimedon queenslandica]
MEDKLEKCVLEAASRFGFSLKEKQLEAIMTFMSGNDVFVSLPTGYGKSLIYALLPVAFDLFKEQYGSIVICVSPLVSLMMDQKAKFLPMGIVAEFVGEGQLDSTAIEKVLHGDIQLLYISPESLICNPMYRNMLLSPIYKNKLVALVIDEAHCIKSWGDSFRVAYAHLGDTRSLIPSHVNILALTATATKHTFRIVCQSLSLREPVLIGCLPDRSNIYYEVQPLPEIEEFCEEIAKELKEMGMEYPKTIIFQQNYSDCQVMYRILSRKLGPYITFPPHHPKHLEFAMVMKYTRASTVEVKESVLRSFSDPKGILRIVLATTAFGMGVDVADVRVIYHWRPPSSLEQYVQESGRAGRDNKPSKAILLYGKPSKFVEQGVKDYGNNKTKCRRQLLLNDFLFVMNHDSTDNDNNNCCDVCIKL